MTAEKINHVHILKLIKNEDYEQAYDFISECLAKDIENYLYYNYLGVVQELLGEREKALKFYRIAYYLNQGCEDAKQNLDRLSAFNPIDIEPKYMNIQKKCWFQRAKR